MSTSRQVLSTDHRSCLRAALVVGGVNIMVGTGLLINTQIEESAGRASLNFAKTTGKVVFTHESIGSTHDPNVVRYEYLINGRTFQCARVGFPSHTKFTDLVKYPKGKDVTVYYDAAKPADACLEPGVKSENYSWNAGVGWFWIGFGALLVPLVYWFTRKNGLGYRRRVAQPSE